MQAKTCSQCGELKSFAEYNKKASHKDGLRSECRECQTNKNKAYRAIHKEQGCAYAKRYRSLYPEKKRETCRNWNRKNPNKCYSYVKNNRARQKSIWGSVNARKRNRIFDRYNGVCQLCMEPIDRLLKWPHSYSYTIDHIKPRSKGGTNEESNLQIAHFVCNIRKGGDYDYKRSRS